MRLIEEKRLKELLKAEELVNNLQAYGVDNWDGWYSWEDDEEMTDEELEIEIKKYIEGEIK